MEHPSARSRIYEPVDIKTGKAGPYVHTCGGYFVGAPETTDFFCIHAV
jgi:hypothetical protein